jgi:hypothetical protein
VNIHKQSVKKFLGGSIGEAYGEDLVKELLWQMEQHGSEKLEVTSHFFDAQEMDYQKGDVTVSVTLTFKKIHEE